MNKDDAGAFDALITELAECFDRHKPTEGAMRHWYRALQGFPLEDVRRAITGWIDGKAKFPAISELAHECIEIGTRARAVEKVRTDQAGISWISKSQGYPVTPYGSMVIAKMRAFLSDYPKRQASKQWAHDILDAHAAGRGLQYTDPVSGQRMPRGPQPVTASQVEFARSAIGAGAVVREREPGEDDE